MLGVPRAHRQKSLDRPTGSWYMINHSSGVRAWESGNALTRWAIDCLREF